MTAREMIIQWLNKALTLEVNEEIYFPVDSKSTRTETYQRYRKELEIMRQVNPEDAAKIRISAILKDNQHWVVLRRVAVVSPAVGFIKTANGEVTPTSIITANEAERINKLKREDARL